MHQSHAKIVPAPPSHAVKLTVRGEDVSVENEKRGAVEAL